MASGSGLTWQAKATASLLDRTSAALSSSLIAGPLRLDLAQEPRDPFHLLQTEILLEVEVRGELQPDFVPQQRPQMAAGRLQSGARAPVVAVLAEHGVEDRCSPEVGADLNMSDGHEPDSRVLQLRNLLGQHFPILLSDALGPRSPAHRSLLRDPIHITPASIIRPVQRELGIDHLHCRKGLDVPLD